MGPYKIKSVFESKENVSVTVRKLTKVSEGV